MSEPPSLGVSPAPSASLTPTDGKESLPPFKCDHESCSKRFSTIHNLKRHRAVHTTTRLSCPEPGCDKIFYRNDKLRDHIRRAHALPQTTQSRLTALLSKSNELLSLGYGKVNELKSVSPDIHDALGEIASLNTVLAQRTKATPMPLLNPRELEAVGEFEQLMQKLIDMVHKPSQEMDQGTASAESAPQFSADKLKSICSAFGTARYSSSESSSSYFTPYGSDGRSRISSPYSSSLPSYFGYDRSSYGSYPLGQTLATSETQGRFNT